MAYLQQVRIFGHLESNLLGSGSSISGTEDRGGAK